MASSSFDDAPLTFCLQQLSIRLFLWCCSASSTSTAGGAAGIGTCAQVWATRDLAARGVANLDLEDACIPTWVEREKKKQSKKKKAFLLHQADLLYCGCFSFFDPHTFLLLQSLNACTRLLSWERIRQTSHWPETNLHNTQGQGTTFMCTIMAH